MTLEIHEKGRKLWRKVIKAKFRRERFGCLTEILMETYGAGRWKRFIKNKGVFQCLLMENWVSIESESMDRLSDGRSSSLFEIPFNFLYFLRQGHHN